MQTVGVGLFGLPLLLLLSSLASLPLAGPPLPLDPVLQAVAPDECLWFASSSGFAEAIAESTNQTEQLLAEPEMRRFAQAIEEQVMLALRRNAGANRDQRVLASELPKLIRAVLTRPFVAYVEEVALTDESLQVDAGLVLNVGEQRPQLEQALARLLESAGEDAPPRETVEQFGVAWTVLRMPPKVPAVRWGFHESYFILAVGDTAAENILQRMQGSPSSWLEQLRSEHEIERESSLGYLNVQGALQRLRPVLEARQVWQVVQRLGLDGIESAHSVAGFDSEGCAVISHLKTNGERQGVLALLPYKPLSLRDLRTIPANAVLATAVRLDAEQVWDDALRLVEQFHPQVTERVEEHLWEIETRLGVHLKDDVVASLDDVWVGYLPEGDLMTSWLGAAAAVRVKDPERLRQSIDKLVSLAEANIRNRGRQRLTIRQSEHEGHTIHFVNVVGTPFPLAPAWCVSEEWLIFGLMPQTVRSAIDREVAASLADVEQVRSQWEGADGPAVLHYCDTPRLVQSSYPWLQMMAQVLASQMQSEGFDIDVSLLPSVDSIVPHLRPSVMQLSHAEVGFHFRSRHSLPGGGNSLAMTPLAVATLLPAVQAARSAAHQAEEINALRQLALAMLNYESTYRKLPSNIYDDQGNPLLSWRVELLPFLESHVANQQMRRDEPWDSPHNRALLEQMPEVFRSPSSPNLPPGRTRYVALAGEGTLFPGKQEIRLREITDGTSNTLLFVQVAPEHAVEWTKPVDLPFDPRQPFAQLPTERDLFLAAFCDGSCLRLSRAIGAETMRALATCAGGELVDRTRLQRQ